MNKLSWTFCLAYLPIYTTVIIIFLVKSSNVLLGVVHKLHLQGEVGRCQKMSTFCQHLYRKKSSAQGDKLSKKPKSCQRSLWTTPYLVTPCFVIYVTNTCQCNFITFNWPLWARNKAGKDVNVMHGGIYSLWNEMEWKYFLASLDSSALFLNKLNLIWAKFISEILEQF